MVGQKKKMTRSTTALGYFNEKQRKLQILGTEGATSRTYNSPRPQPLNTQNLKCGNLATSYPSKKIVIKLLPLSPPPGKL